MVLHIVVFHFIELSIIYWHKLHLSFIVEKINIIVKHNIMEFDRHFIQRTIGS